MFPSAVVHGTAEFEWLEGERFLLQRSRSDHPEFPDSLIVFGADEEGLSMNYFDSRGVHRIYHVSLSGDVWRMWRHSPGFSQRCNGKLSPDGDTIEGRCVPRRLDVGRRPCDHVPAQIATASAQSALNARVGR
jgi:hypothetical protein